MPTERLPVPQKDKIEPLKRDSQDPKVNQSVTEIVSRVETPVSWDAACRV